MSAHFSVEGLTKRHGRALALDNVSFDMLSSDVLAMIGKNGSGKTTLFNVITGKLKPDRGKVFYRDRNITGLTPQGLFKVGIGCTHQRPAIFSSITALENVKVSIFSTEERAGAMFEAAKDLYTVDALKTLEDFNLSERADMIAARLTIAEQKRLEIAMVMAHYPRLVIMDEPTSGLPAAERSAFLELCMEATMRAGATLFFIERDLDLVFQFAGRVLVLNEGTIIADGTPAEMRDHDVVRDLYLGYTFANLELVNAQTLRR